MNQIYEMFRNGLGMITRSTNSFTNNYNSYENSSDSPPVTDIGN